MRSITLMSVAASTLALVASACGKSPEDRMSDSALSRDLTLASTIDAILSVTLAKLCSRDKSES